VATKVKKKSSTKSDIRKKGSKAAKSSKSTVVSLNMKGVEGRSGGRAHYPEGDYLSKIVKAEIGKSSEKETPAAIVTFQFKDGKLKGKKIREYFYLTEKAMWKVRNLLEGCGVKVPEKSFSFDFKKLVNKDVAITIEDEEWDNKTRSRITDTFPVAEFNANLMEDDEDEADEDEEGDDEDEDEDEEEDDEDEDEDEEDDDEEEDDELDEVDLDEV
jgi:hypothetical protein